MTVSNADVTGTRSRSRDRIPNRVSDEVPGYTRDPSNTESVDMRGLRRTLARIEKRLVAIETMLNRPVVGRRDAPQRGVDGTLFLPGTGHVPTVEQTVEHTPDDVLTAHIREIRTTLNKAS